MTIPVIAIIDYGLGNVRSIANALEKVGVQPVLTRDHTVIRAADGVILPGVGAFSQGMENLHKFNLCDIICRLAAQGKPLLGICLGMQMLMTTSEEFGIHNGLGIITGEVVKVQALAKLPHVGWNEIVEPEAGRWHGSILHDTPQTSSVYFVHSFAVCPRDSVHILAFTDYGGSTFVSAIQRGNLSGCQFHPEKSGETGLGMLRKFSEML